MEVWVEFFPIVLKREERRIFNIIFIEIQYPIFHYWHMFFVGKLFVKIWNTSRFKIQKVLRRKAKQNFIFIRWRFNVSNCIKFYFKKIKFQLKKGLQYFNSRNILQNSVLKIRFKILNEVLWMEIDRNYEIFYENFIDFSQKHY